MFAEGTKLKKLNDDTYQVIDEGREEDKRPLEWRRAYNTLVLELRNYNFRDRYDVHNIDCFSSLEDVVEEVQEKAKGERARSLSINSVVDPDKVRDRIFFGGKTDDEKVVELIAPSGAINVTLEASEPSMGRCTHQSVVPQHIEQGYWGTIVHNAFEPGEDDIYVEVRIPQDQFELISERIQTQPDVITRLFLSVRCFTYEVEDWYREPWHAQDLFVDWSVGEPPLAFVKFVEQFAEPVSLQKDVDEEGYESPYEDEDEDEELSMVSDYIQRLNEFNGLWTDTYGVQRAWIIIKTLPVLAISLFLLLNQQYVASGLFALVATVIYSSEDLYKLIKSVPVFVAHKVALEGARLEKESKAENC